MNRESKKTTKRDGAKKKAGKPPEPELEQKAEPVTLFEFYKIFPYDARPDAPPDIPRTGYETELCKPPCQRVSRTNLQSTLATVCAEAYGEGDFIALEVGGVSEGQAQGLPLAYWLVRVKPNKHGIPCRKAEQIALDDEDHEHLEILKRHPALVQASEEDEQLVKFDHEHGHHFRKDPWASFFRDYAASRDDIDPDEWRRLGDPYQGQRGVCAGQMSEKYFDLMPDPQAGEGMKPHDYIRLRTSQGAQRDEIISELTYNKGPFQLSLKDAQTKWDSVQRTNQMRRKKEREKEQKQTNPVKNKTKK